MKNRFFSILTLALSLVCFAGLATDLSAQITDGYPRNNSIDVQHYVFELSLSDETDEIEGLAHVSIDLLEEISSFELDLVSNNGAGKGMVVSSVKTGERDLTFKQKGERLAIELTAELKGSFVFDISYSGVPADGLVIGKNKFGDRTYFGDNWPNRAHHWLPCIDHPSDKATVEFKVTAPDHYQVVSNGFQIEETNMDELTYTHWKSEVKLPTKVMVIGVAPFAVKHEGFHNYRPVQSWVFEENREEGFRDYSAALKVLDFFEEYVAPYPYEKLANVQSKTRYGGMENAGAIFYYENSVTGNQEVENLIAHEIAHQWFGNSASEFDWHHIWLSEGFATYFTELHKEWAYGREAFVKGMELTRKDVREFKGGFDKPVIDPSVKNYNKLLNPNSYEKGAWVLHMLRHKIGDEAFQKGVRNYYQKYKESNASTNDLRAEMEKSSTKDLNGFFQQWLEEAQHPKLKTDYNEKKRSIEISQTQSKKKEFPLDVLVKFEDGSELNKTLVFKKKKQSFKIKKDKKISEIILDPDCWLLFEED